MRVAYLTGEYPRATDTFVQREIAAHDAAGVEVVRVAIRKPAASHLVGPEQRDEAQRTFYVLPCSPIRLLTDHAACLLKNPGRYFRTLASALKHRSSGIKPTLLQMAYFAEAAVITRHLLKHNVEHLHNHFANSSCSVSMLVSELSGIPYSFTMHGPAIFFEPKRWSLGEKIKRAKFVACISHFCRSQGMAFARPEHWPKMRIVHCGIDPQRYGQREHTGQGTELTYVGRLAAVKGLPVLLQAMTNLPDQVKLTVVGDGEDRPLLEQMARELGLDSRVTFAGYQSQDAVRDRLAATDVFVMSSFAEGVPVVLMEAMASGVPVVATRIAGIAELVEEDESGLLVPPGDSVSLVTALGRLIGDASLRESFGTSGRRFVAEQFNFHDEAAWLRKLFVGDTTPAQLRPDIADTAAVNETEQPRPERAIAS